MEKKTAQPYLPERITYQSLREASQKCKGCELYKNATQTVFGEGHEDERIMFIGEQPGYQEDQEGHPFIGPAGHILDRAFKESGIRRDSVYITNAVKHFKWTPQGKKTTSQKTKHQ